MKKFMRIKSVTVLMAMNLMTFGNNLFANESVKASFKKLDWQGIEVNYLEDNRFPTYDMVIYFADGALSDENHKGLTNHAFNLIHTGTPTLSQEQILDQIEFLGTEIDTNVTHEFSTLSMSGLAKDFNSAMKDTCHILREANFPMDVVKTEIEKEKSELEALVSHPQALAERINREVTMQGTPYLYPVSGKLKDLDTYNSSLLRGKLDYFLDKVKKRIYLTGPKSILDIQKILNEDCRFKGSSSNFTREVKFANKVRPKTQFVFVPLPDANQVQVRFGRFLDSGEIANSNLDTLASELLGGGFTSVLMREVRVKRGLTYSINSTIGAQKEYGRAIISTFTKNETVNQLVDVIDNALTRIKKSGVSNEELERSRSGLMGSHPFKFENNKAFLMQLLSLDHAAKDYSELFEFNEKIANFTAKDVSQKISDVFDLKKQIIFILGDKGIEKTIKRMTKKYGKLKVLNYRDFI